MLGDQARAVCPEIILVQVCVAHKKADLAIYREAGAKVINIPARYGPTERASIDEAYVDLTAAAQAKLKEFGPEMIDRARKQSKLAGLEGQEQQALSREDVRNGVLVGGGGDRKEEKNKEGQETKSFLPTAATGSDNNVGAGTGDDGTKPASPATATTNISTITTMEHGTQQPSSTTSSSNETGTSSRSPPSLLLLLPRPAPLVRPLPGGPAPCIFGHEAKKKWCVVLQFSPKCGQP
jgi:hypothetical protein